MKKIITIAIIVCIFIGIMFVTHHQTPKTPKEIFDKQNRLLPFQHDNWILIKEPCISIFEEKNDIDIVSSFFSVFGTLDDAEAYLCMLSKDDEIYIVEFKSTINPYFISKGYFEKMGPKTFKNKFKFKYNKDKNRITMMEK